MFRTFDGDGDNVVDYREMIWGLSLLDRNSVCYKFEKLWEDYSLGEEAQPPPCPPCGVPAAWWEVTQWELCRWSSGISLQC